MKILAGTLVYLAICCGTISAASNQASAPGPGQYHVDSPVAAPPAQSYTSGSPAGTVTGLFKNLTIPPTAYVSFQTVVQDTALEDFDKATQTYYINSIASYLKGSASQVVILRIDGSPRQVTTGPPQANQSVIHQAPAAAPLRAPYQGMGRFGPAAGPMYRPMAPGPGGPFRRSLLQVNSGEAASPPAAGPTLYIYTAVTLDTSGVGGFIESLFENTTGVLDPQGQAHAEDISIQNVIWGIANPGYTPHVAAGSPIVTFQMQVKDNGDDDSVLFPLLPLIVLNSVYQPDLTAITLSIDSDDNADSSVLMAVAFNGLPKSNAVQAAANFAKKLNASATSSSMVPFVTPASVTIQDISDVRQQTANDAGGFESEAYDGIIYNPTIGTASGSSGAAVAPNTNAIVNFTMRLQQYSEASWTGTDGSNPSGQDRYVYTLTTWLRTHASPYAYAEVTSYTAGSITAETGSIIPYSNTNTASSTNAAAAVATLQSTLSSDSASIFDPQIFGTTTASGITSSGVTATSPPPPPASTKKSTNKGAIAGGVIGGVAGVAILGVAGYFIYKKVTARRAYAQ